MVGDFQRRVAELRFLEGVEKVEHVPYTAGDEFWVRFNNRLDMNRLKGISDKHGYAIVKFGGLPSKLPRPLAEILWDGVSYVITRKGSGLAKFTSSLGLEPDGIAKIVSDAHGPYQIYITRQEDGVQILYEYLGLKYTPPAPPPPKPAPAKPVAAIVAKPAAPVPKPLAPAAPTATGTSPAATPQPPKPAAEQTEALST